ncbi:hypothetical protein ACQK5W_18965 [Pantoea sp. FN060301]|uniref:hypothetical protein n=1 Tax=Pantoea sp. FN060301 TaxID=3420380 RepID=UPI003D16CF9B
MLAAELFRLLASGVHPETGEPLPPDSLVHRPEAIRLLFLLAEEFSGMHFRQIKRREKVKLTPEERRQKNRQTGRPENAFLPWQEEEKQQLAAQVTGDYSIPELGKRFGRSPRSIALQLVKMKLITAEAAAAYE